MEKVLRYVANGLGLAILGVTAMIAIGEGMEEGFPNLFMQPTAVQLGFAALGVALAGTLVALKWERVGGAMIVAASLFFVGMEWVLHHKLFPFMLVFALIGLLHIIASVTSRPETERTARSAD